MSRAFRTPLRLAGALVVALLAACSDAPVAPGVDPQRYERLDLDVALGSPPVGDEVALQRFYIPAESAAWDVDSPSQRFARIPGTDTRTFLLRAGPGDGHITLTRDGEFDLSAINTVRLVYTFAGLGWVSVGFYDGDQLVHRSPSVFLESNDTPVPISVPLELGGTTGLCDRIEVICGSKSNRVVRFVSVETLDSPPGRLLPPAAGPPVPYALGLSSRLAQRLVSGRPLETSVELGEGAELRFAYGRESVPAGASAELLVSLRDVEGGLVASKRFAAPPEPKAWTQASFDLAEHAGRIFSLSFELDGEEQAWLVGEVALWGPGRDSRPSVLFVTSDTHRADHVGVAPDGVDVRTPALDELAEQGLLFLDCTSPSNVTNPSHVSMMTGIAPRDTGIVINRVPLANRGRTLAEVFGDAGYVTLASIGVGHIGHEGSGLGQGFDRMAWPPAGSRDAVEVVDIAEEWLDEVGERPVFVWVHVFDAHWPYTPPGEFDRMYYAGPDPFDASLEPLDVPDTELPSDMQGLRVLEFPRSQYRAEISYLDDQLSRLFELAPMRDAIIALTSDHGEGLGESDVWFKHAELYPGSLRVPLMLRWPDGPRGVRVPEPVTNLDVGHTLVALAGLDASAFPGRDLTEVVGLDETSEPLRFVISSGAQSAALQDGDDYLILHLVDHDAPLARGGYVKHQVELYDLRTDPTCQDDLVERDAAKAMAMRARLVEWLGQATGDLRGEANESEEFLAQLTALGYVDQEVGAGESFWEGDDCAWCRRMR